MNDFHESEKVFLNLKMLSPWSVIGFLSKVFAFCLLTKSFWPGASSDAGWGGEGAGCPALLHEGRAGPLQQQRLNCLGRLGPLSRQPRCKSPSSPLLSLWKRRTNKTTGFPNVWVGNKMEWSALPPNLDNIMCHYHHFVTDILSSIEYLYRASLVLQLHAFPRCDTFLNRKYIQNIWVSEKNLL